MKIDRAFLRDFNKDALAALEKVASEHGVSLRQGSARFTESNATLKFELSAITSSGEVLKPEVQAFKRSAERFGLHPDDLGGTFIVNKTKYRLTGLKTRRPKLPITADRVYDGRGFKFPASSVTNVQREGASRRAAIESQQAREPLTEEIKKQFVKLVCELSPENISWDGERSRADIRKATVAIKKQWRELEARIWRSVGESEAFGFENF